MLIIFIKVEVKVYVFHSLYIFIWCSPAFIFSIHFLFQTYFFTHVLWHITIPQLVVFMNNTRWITDWVLIVMDNLIEGALYRWSSIKRHVLSVSWPLQRWFAVCPLLILDIKTEIIVFFILWRCGTRLIQMKDRRVIIIYCCVLSD